MHSAHVPLSVIFSGEAFVLILASVDRTLVWTFVVMNATDVSTKVLWILELSVANETVPIVLWPAVCISHDPFDK